MKNVFKVKDRIIKDNKYMGYLMYVGVFDMYNL